MMYVNNVRFYLNEFSFTHPCTWACETDTTAHDVPLIVLHQILQARKHLSLIQIETYILILMDLNVFHFLVID